MIGGQVFVEHTNIIAIGWRSFSLNFLIILSLDLAYITQWLTPVLADLSLAALNALALVVITVVVVVVTGDMTLLAQSSFIAVDTGRQKQNSSELISYGCFVYHQVRGCTSVASIVANIIFLQR
jgi:hypothetical protein